MPRVHHGGHEAAAAAAVVRYGAPRPPPGVLCKSYRCHSMACLDRPGLELGDKIIMPQSAFKEAHQLRLRLPLLFKVVGKRRKGIVGPPPCQFCGVLEFSARQGQVFLPYWMMQNLLLSEGEQVELRSILHPPAGSFVRFRPHNDTFLNVAAQQGPKALMECALRRYSVLSEGVTILVQVAKGFVFHGMERSSVIETITHVPQEMCLNVGRFVDVDNRSMVKVSPQALMHRKNVFGGKVKGMAKLAAIGSHIPHPLGFGHWTASHIVSKAMRQEFSDDVVADKLINTLDPRHTTVALYVAT